LPVIALPVAIRYLQPEVYRSPQDKYPVGHGATANVAYAHHNGNGNVLDEWV
jgi:hypothetical protein